MLKIVSQSSEYEYNILDDYDNTIELTTKNSIALLNKIGLFIEGYTYKDYSIQDFSSMFIPSHNLDSNKCCIMIEKVIVNGIDIQYKVTIGVSSLNKEKCILFLNQDSNWREQHSKDIDYITENVINKVDVDSIKFIGGFQLSQKQVSSLSHNDNYVIAFSNKFRLYLKDISHMEEIDLVNRKLIPVFGEIKKKVYIHEEQVAEYFSIIEELGYFIRRTE